MNVANAAFNTGRIVGCLPTMSGSGNRSPKQFLRTRKPRREPDQVPQGEARNAK
jgi:hypothetical protein